MAPLKLPPKKPKGKGKQLHIDYATPDSARASAPADWTAEHWLEGRHLPLVVRREVETHRH